MTGDMSSSPWHMEALGLPVHADRSAVRRAYAQMLRAIDPATDPAAFERLRAAYEAARAWCDQQDPAPPPPAPATVQTDPVAPAAESHVPPVGQDRPSAQAHPPVAVRPSIGVLRTDDVAAEQAAWFSAQLEGRGMPDVRGLLIKALASLRSNYIDAPGQFEEHLVDQLMAGTIAHRVDVFEAALIQFHWDEVGPARTNPRRAWIDRVLAQREMWRAIPSVKQSLWLNRLVQARGPIEAALARHWAAFEPLNASMPDWIMLHTTPTILAAWRSAFEAMSSIERAEYTRVAQKTERPATKGGWAYRIFRGVRLAIIGLAIGAVLFLISGIFEWYPKRISAYECATLYARMDRPAALDHVAPAEADELKRTAHACVSQGDWKAPDPALPSR